jgi:hypothetical protein
MVQLSQMSYVSTLGFFRDWRTGHDQHGSGDHCDEVTEDKGCDHMYQGTSFLAKKMQNTTRITSPPQETLMHTTV